MLLDGKSIVISGVGAGLGQSLARRAAAEGAFVMLAARNQAFLDEVGASIAASGGRAIAMACDVADVTQCAALASSAAAAFGGRIDGLINSAYAHGEWSFLQGANPTDFARSFDVNCLGALRMSQACLPWLKGGGAIVNVSTMATVRPFGSEHGMEMGYAVSKGALNTLSKYMAADLGRHGIRVNSCRMGWIHGAPVQAYLDSQVAAGSSRADAIGAITKDIPIGIIPPEDDCARAILMLLSDHARVISGATLDINGGHWMAP